MGYGQWAGGTHPIGMHSCQKTFVRKNSQCFISYSDIQRNSFVKIKMSALSYGKMHCFYKHDLTDNFSMSWTNAKGHI